ncbi:MAG: hypothetical protein EYC62_02940 [Alphaproteobacteria bacterium]|nr:MAG: hypothetical protein EYC62_02940 [Alphaproteobacteria bacterium]
MKILYKVETTAADKSTQKLAASGQPAYDHVLVTYENQADHTSIVISYRTDFHIPVIPQDHPHKSWQWIQKETARRKKGAEIIQQFEQYRADPEGFLEALREQGAVADDCYIYDPSSEKFRAPAHSVTNTQTGHEIYRCYETCGTPTMGPDGQKSVTYSDPKTGRAIQEYRYDPSTGLVASEVDWRNVDGDRVPAIEYVRDKTGNVVYKLCTIYQPRQNIYYNYYR